MLDLALILSAGTVALGGAILVLYLELRLVIAIARKFPVVATAVATALVILGAFAVAPAQAAEGRPAGPLVLTVHDVPRDTNGDSGSWAWSGNGNVIRAAAPSAAYRELYDFGTGYRYQRPNGTTVSNYGRTLRLSGDTVVDGPCVYAGMAGGPVPVVSKGIVRVPQFDVDHYIKVVLEARNGDRTAFWVQLVR